MKRHSSNASAPKAAQASAASTGDPAAMKPETWGPELEQTDATWNLLTQASEREPDMLFARNVVRLTRQLEDAPTTWKTRLASLFAPSRLALGTAACACALLAYAMWPPSETPDPGIVEQPTAPIAPSSALSELLIEETLDAAAEDPTIFTHDEVVAMIGF